MGSKGGSAPSPDPNIGKAALKQAELGEQWLEFARQQFGEANQRQAGLDELNRQVTEQQMGFMQQGADWAARDRARYEDKFLPMEDRFIDKATQWDSPERQAKLAEESRASVLSQSETMRNANERRMASMGVDPRSGRYSGIDQSQDTATALAAAGAENQARNQVRQQGMAMEADVLNFGRGLPSQAAGGANLSLSAGGQALQGNMGVNQMANQNTQIMGQGFGGAMQGYAGMGQGLSSLYGQQLSGWQTQQQANAANLGGVMSGLGTFAGFAMMSSKEAKKDKKSVPEGKSLEAVKGMPVDYWTYKEGMGDGGSHVGTYAEDFKKQTGQGNGKEINVIDAIGVTMGAIKDLDKKVEKMARGKRS